MGYTSAYHFHESGYRMNSTELQEQWELICNKIREYDTINSSQMNAFFSRLQPQAMSEDFIMLTADNDFIKTWIELHYSRYIQQALKDMYGVDFTVAIEVDINQTVPETDEKPLVEDKPQKKEEKKESTSSLPQKIEKNNDRNDVREGLDKGIISSISTLTFENFVIGESNRMAYSMAVAVAEEPGRPMLNPLFIYGRSGLGKTHLMRAIQNYVNETRPDLSTVYVDSADFLSGYVDASVAHDKQKSSYKNFKHRYQNADILLIDDIQYLQGKEQTLDISATRAVSTAVEHSTSNRPRWKRSWASSRAS